jgi:hypothetical protein
VQLQGKSQIWSIQLIKQIAFGAMITLMATIARESGPGTQRERTREEHLMFCAYVWHCVKTAPAANFTALTLIGKGGDKPQYAKHHLHLQIMRRFHSHLEPIFEAAKLLCEIDDNVLLNPFWTAKRIPDVLSPVHLCAQALREEVSRHNSPQLIPSFPKLPTQCSKSLLASPMALSVPLRTLMAMMAMMAMRRK